jgi:methyltransferase (TIGR00027 family)
MRKAIPSRTARKVALNIITLGTVANMKDVLPPGLTDATAELLVQSEAIGRSSVRFARSRMAVGIHRAFDRMTPGQFEAFGHRKAFCERQVRDAIRNGTRQVLVLGAGYDTIGWRLAAEFPEVEFFEIDHPATACMKAKGIEAMGMRANLHLLAGDLGERRLADVLEANEIWEKHSPTAFVAEGLVMYLSPDAAGSLFDQCAAVSGDGSRMVFSYVGTREDGGPDAGAWSWLVLWSLKVSGEPWLWSIEPDQLGPFLLEHSWTIASSLSPHSERRGVEFFAVAVKQGCRSSAQMPSGI